MACGQWGRGIGGQCLSGRPLPWPLENRLSPCVVLREEPVLDGGHRCPGCVRTVLAWLGAGLADLSRHAEWVRVATVQAELGF